MVHDAGVRPARIALFSLAALLLLPASAGASIWGSSLRNAPNLPIGCSQAPIRDSITGAPVLVRTGQRTCTYRSGGILNGPITAGTSYVPGNGRVVAFSVRSGRNPAPLRLTIMQGSPGLCCTGEKFSQVVRPRPNRISTFRTNLRVTRSVSRDPIKGIQNVQDVVAITAVGPGTLPLRSTPGAGGFSSGLPIVQHWHPRITIGQPRNEDAYTMTGVELLLRWEWRR